MKTFIYIIFIFVILISPARSNFYNQPLCRISINELFMELERLCYPIIEDRMMSFCAKLIPLKLQLYRDCQ